MAAGAPAHSSAWAASRAEQPAHVWGIRHSLSLNLHLLSPICQQPQHSKAVGGLAEAQEHPGHSWAHSAARA